MPSPDGPLLEARGLVRRFGRSVVLDGLDLDLAAGEVLLVMGANGAGKSTLLRLLAGLARPDRGTVRVGGDGVAARRGAIGYLAHETHLYDDLTVDENLAFSARLHGGIGGAAIESFLDGAGLLGARGRLVRTLSRGQQQRLALIRARLHAPDLLLLDEPFTGLDRENAAALTRTLLALRGEGRGVVLVEHQPEDGWEAVTRLGILARGGWAFLGPRPADPAAAVARYREAQHG